MGGALRRSVGRLRAWRPGEDQGRAGSRGLQDLRRAARRLEKVGRTAQAEMGGRREEGRRRSRRDLERAAGVTDAIQRGLLKLKPPLPGGRPPRQARQVGKYGG